MTEKFTPGPWFTHPSTVSEGSYVIESRELPILASTFNWPKNAEANAHLIAAAPELYEALEDVYRYISPMLSWRDDAHQNTHFQIVLQKISTALSKARGE